MSAPGCPFCAAQKTARVLETALGSLLPQRPELRAQRVDFSKQEGMADRYHVMTAPSYLFLDAEGSALGSFSGQISAEALAALALGLG